MPHGKAGGKHHHCPGLSGPVDGHPARCRQVKGKCGCQTHELYCVEHDWVYMINEECDKCENAEAGATRRAARLAEEKSRKGQENDNEDEPVKKKRAQKLQPAPRIQDLRKQKKKGLDKQAEEAHAANLHKLARKKSQTLKEEAAERVAAKERARLEAEKLAEEIERQLSSQVEGSSIEDNQADAIGDDDKENGPETESETPAKTPAKGKRKASSSPEKRREGTGATPKRTRAN
ncbi:hypothetical protein B0J14DRAFT_671650 [Halenospora varia]|nr:hypothetical protein B0J14DRAFT_671650 [Halenospora varia]